MQDHIHKTASARFVILHHKVHGGEHWDLLLQRGEILLTWQLARSPVEPGGFPQTAQKLSDHRLFYLDHEGPVDGDRGSVERADSGTIMFSEASPDRYVVKLTGTKLAGTFALVRNADERWTVSQAD